MEEEGCLISQWYIWSSLESFISPGLHVSSCHPISTLCPSSHFATLLKADSNVHIYSSFLQRLEFRAKLLYAAALWALFLLITCDVLWGSRNVSPELFWRRCAFSHVPFFSIPCIKGRAKFGDICSQAQYSHHYLPFGIHVSESSNDQNIFWSTHRVWYVFTIVSHVGRNSEKSNRVVKKATHIWYQAEHEVLVMFY